MQTLHIAIDESGTFGSSQELFVYGGFAILGDSKFQAKLRKYVSVENRIGTNCEVKANRLKVGDKLQLLDVMKSQYTFAICVETGNYSWRDKDKVYKAILKDDLLLNLIIEVLKDFDLKQVGKLIIEIDEQNLSFGLKENIYINLLKYLGCGSYFGLDYQPPKLNHNIEVIVSYVDSSKVPLVRASDILVNTLFHTLQNKQDVGEFVDLFKIVK